MVNPTKRDTNRHARRRLPASDESALLERLAGFRRQFPNNRATDATETDDRGADEQGRLANPPRPTTNPALEETDATEAGSSGTDDQGRLANPPRRASNPAVEETDATATEAGGSGTDDQDRLANPPRRTNNPAVIWADRNAGVIEHAVDLVRSGQLERWREVPLQPGHYSTELVDTLGDGTQLLVDLNTGRMFLRELDHELGAGQITELVDPNSAAQLAEQPRSRRRRRRRARQTPRSGRQPLSEQPSDIRTGDSIVPISPGDRGVEPATSRSVVEPEWVLAILGSIFGPAGTAGGYFLGSESAQGQRLGRGMTAFIGGIGEGISTLESQDQRDRLLSILEEITTVAALSPLPGFMVVYEAGVVVGVGEEFIQNHPAILIPNILRAISELFTALEDDAIIEQMRQAGIELVESNIAQLERIAQSDSRISQVFEWGKFLAPLVIEVLTFIASGGVGTLARGASGLQRIARKIADRVRPRGSVERALDPNSPFSVNESGLLTSGDVLNNQARREIGRLNRLQTEILTTSQLAAARLIVGQRLNGVLRATWRAAMSPLDHSEIRQINEMMRRARNTDDLHLRRTLEAQAYDMARNRVYPRIRRNFWNLVRDTPSIADIFRDAGLVLRENRVPAWILPDGSDVKLSIEHAVRVSDDPTRAADPSNMLLTPLRENTRILEEIRGSGRHMNFEEGTDIGSADP